MESIQNNERDNADRFLRAVEDVTAFPILTEDIGSIGTAGIASPGASPGRSSYDGLVKNTLREILNWGPRSFQDPKGFATALTQSFEVKEVAGRTVTTHVPRSYVMQVQSDGGAVTGAQASIFARAQAALQQCLPLLEGLYPLQPGSDPEDLAATVATLRMGLSHLVDELGRQGGPRPQRIDSLFELLLGTEITARSIRNFSSDRVGGQLGLLRDRLGFELARVNNAEEEKNLTNFLILADHVFTLWLSWSSLRTYFDRTGSQVFLGPQLVLLSRAMAVVAEQVRETYFTFDSVFVGPAERETTFLPFAPPEPRLTISELLEWAERFASEEAPQLMREAGKDGVIAFRPTLQRLLNLFTEAVAISRREARNPSPGLHTLRVANSFESVRQQLANAARLAHPLNRAPRPSIEAIDPRTVVDDGQSITIRIEGEHFQPGSSVRLNRASDPDVNEGKEARRVHFGSSSTLWATFDAEDVEPGVWSVIVLSPDHSYDVLRKALTIADSEIPEPGAPPVLEILDPTGGEPGRTITVILQGIGFRQSSKVRFDPEADINVLETKLESENTLNALVNIGDGAKSVTRSVTVVNPGTPEDLESNSLPFQILKPASGDRLESRRKNRNDR
jgi:hypothetical protein